MSARATIRIALGILIVSALWVGVWAAVAPRSFFLDFPGGGHTWVAVGGGYNEHLVRDVGELNLALALVTIAAFVWLGRRLVTVAGAAWLVYSVPHLAYHSFNLHPVASGDRVAEIASLASAIVVAGYLVVAGRRLDAASG
jgi:hypothetical protein